MKLKMYQVMGFIKMVDSLSDKKIPLTVAYKLAKLRAKMLDDMTFYQKRVGQCVELYAERDENNNVVINEETKNIKIQKAKLKEFNEKLAELDEMEVEVPCITFTLPELEGLSIGIDEMELLLPFIAE